MTGIYRERKRAIFSALCREFGKSEAYDQFTWGYQDKKCTVCGSEVVDYSEWNETGYETKHCTNGCWSIKTYGMKTALATKGFYRSIIYDRSLKHKAITSMWNHAENHFNQALLKERRRVKRMKQLTHRKSK
ncbi:hypothetical protein [Lysinibacillus fusiformis]|uniref:hypothetical protein n=1 Tax=Lysinibacillus fusiformis TaxID=28031 RepID=UPI003D03D76B